MQSVHTALSPRSLERLEKQISDQVKAKQQDLFEGRSVIVSEGDELYEQFDKAFDQVLESYPAAANGSKYVACTCKVCPTLNVNLSHFHGIFKEAVPGSLFLDEVGKAIDFGPLKDPDLGYFTTHNTTLKIKNIRYTPGAVLRPNEHSGLAPSNKKIIAINAKTICGALDTNPALKKTEMIADVTFGEYLSVKNMVIPVETLGDETTTELIIALPPLTSKIAYDGTIRFENGAVCNIEDIRGPEPVQWINNTWSIVVPFSV